MKRYVFFLAVLLACAAVQAQELQPFVRGSQQSILTAHRGKPFILALWSLDCTNCLDDMAMFGKMTKKYRNLDLVMVSTDTPQQRKQIANMLQRYRLGNVESWVFANSFVERLRYEIDAQWYGELPRTYFFDAQGRSIPVSGKLDRSQVENWIRGQRHESRLKPEDHD